MGEKTAIVTCKECGTEARRPANWQETQRLEAALPSDQPEGWARLTLEWEICPACVIEGEKPPPREGDEEENGEDEEAED